MAPKGMSEVTAQVLVSLGDGITSSQTYASLSLPYVLGIPSGQVQLFVAETLLKPKGNAARLRFLAADANRFGGEDSQNVFPSYEAYATDVYNRALCCSPPQLPIPTCTLRWIIGHGYKQAGGLPPALAIGPRDEFVDIVTLVGPNHATVLTIIDCCNAPEIVRCLTGGVKGEDTFKKKIDIPLVCPTQQLHRGFFLSQTEHHACLDNKTNAGIERFMPPNINSRASMHFAFSLGQSFLLALRKKVEGGDNRDISTIFVECFRQIDTRYVRNQANQNPVQLTLGKPPFVALDKFETFFENVLGSHLQADNRFNYMLLNQSDEWFFSRDLLHSVGEDLAGAAIDYIVTEVKALHKANGKELFQQGFRGEIPIYTHSQLAWETLKGTLGFPYSAHLANFVLVEEDGAIFSAEYDDAVVEQAEGRVLSLEDCAAADPAFPEVVDIVIDAMEKGSPDGLAKGSGRCLHVP